MERLYYFFAAGATFDLEAGVDFAGLGVVVDVDVAAGAVAPPFRTCEIKASALLILLRSNAYTLSASVWSPDFS